jgi:hypothetical protein
MIRAMYACVRALITSLDGYTEDAHADFGWRAPEDESVRSYINDLRLL